LGIYDQAIWNTINGKLFHSSLDFLSNAKSNLIAQHGEIVILPLSFFYLVYPNPKILIFLQVVTVLSSSIPLYLIAKKKLNNKIVSLIIAIVFLLYPPLEWAILFEFNPINLVVPSLIWGYFFLINGRKILFIILLIFALSCKEIVSVSGILLGIILCREKTYKKIGLITIVVSLIWLILIIGIIIPSLNNNSVHPLLPYFSDSNNTTYEGFFENLKTNFINKIFNKDNFRLIIQLLFPIGFLPLLSPLWLVPIIPYLSLLLIAIKPEMKLINFHYSSLITVFLFFSLIESFLLIKKNKKLSYLVVVIIFILSILSNYLYSPSPLSRRFEKPPYLSYEKITKITSVLNKISKNKSITITQRLGSHLSQRENVYIFPDNIFSSDYVVLDTINFPKRPWLIAVYQEERLGVIKKVNELEKSNNYYKYYKDENLAIFIKK